MNVLVVGGDVRERVFNQQVCDESRYSSDSAREDERSSGVLINRGAASTRRMLISAQILSCCQ